jgi:hypothetical protein
MKICELVVCGEIYCTANSLCKNALKGRHTSLGSKLHFYILVTLHLGVILKNNQHDAQFLLYIFISILYLFRATLCSSSGESIVSTTSGICRESK